MNGAQNTIQELPLHDAVVQDILVGWSEKRVTVKLNAFLEPKSNANPCKLIFEDVTNIEIPHQAPWGASSCINKAWFEGGFYIIEMQSGDALKIKASSYGFQKVAL